MSLPEHIKDAIEKYIPHMEGWTSVERCCEMAAAIIKTKPKVCCDIGVYAGRSTIAQGFALRDNLNQGMVYGIDPWSPEVAYDGDDDEASKVWWKDKSNLEEMHRQAVQAVWNHHLEQWVTLIRQRSEYVFKLFPQIGVLNIDGGHGEEFSCRDVRLYVPMVKQGGYVFMDDCDWPQTQKAIILLEQQCELVNVVKGVNEARTYRKK